MIADFYIFYIKVSLLITIAVVAAPFLVVGIRGFKTQRPFLISLRWVSRAVLVFSVSLFLAAVIFCIFCFFRIFFPSEFIHEPICPCFFRLFPPDNRM